MHTLRKQPSASQAEETCNADPLFYRFQNFTKVNFCCLSHPSVVFGYVSPIKLIQWIPDNTDVKTIIDISQLEIKPVALCLISAKLLYVKLCCKGDIHIVITMSDRWQTELQREWVVICSQVLPALSQSSGQTRTLPFE